MKTIADLLREQPFFKDLGDDYIATIAGCGRNVVFKNGEVITREEQPADEFYIVREGKIAIDITGPARGPLTIQTIEGGELLGFSWIVPPYLWRFNSRAIETTHAVSLDGKCLRGKCELDTKLGYELLKHFAEVLSRRLEMTRLQLLDIYAVKS